MHAATRHAVAKVQAQYPTVERSTGRGARCAVLCIGSRPGQMVKCGQPATEVVDGVRCCDDHA